VEPDLGGAPGREAAHRDNCLKGALVVVAVGVEQGGQVGVGRGRDVGEGLLQLLGVRFVEDRIEGLELEKEIATRRAEMAELEGQMRGLERKRIVDALERSGGNQTRAAEALGISRRTLLNRLDEFGLPRPRKKG